jgi:hypothetical protein
LISHRVRKFTHGVTTLIFLQNLTCDLCEWYL